MDGKGEMPRNGALMSKLMLWETGAQSHQGPSEESFEQASQLSPREMVTLEYFSAVSKPRCLKVTLESGDINYTHTHTHTHTHTVLVD